uniref:Uncharacterized protein n=1 Tax=Schizaphis graminum TaxID=13262 RepID=A0A2S2NA13_SCHGA
MGLLTQLLVMIVRPRVAVIEFSAVVLMITTVIVIVVVLLAALLLTALLVVAATVVIAVTIRLYAVRDGRLSHSRSLLSSVAHGCPLASLVRIWGGGAVFVVVRVFVPLPVELQTVVIVVVVAVAVAVMTVAVVVVRDKPRCGGDTWRTAVGEVATVAEVVADLGSVVDGRE